MVGHIEEAQCMLARYRAQLVNAGARDIGPMGAAGMGAGKDGKGGAS